MKKLFHHEDSKAMKCAVERYCAFWSSSRFSNGYGFQELDKVLSNVILQLTQLQTGGWARGLLRFLPTWTNMWSYDSNKKPAQGFFISSLSLPPQYRSHSFHHVPNIFSFYSL